MLFTYPLAATTENWISASLLGLLGDAVQCLQQGGEPPDFNASIAAEYQNQFARGRKFPLLYKTFVDSCRPLSAEQRGVVLEALAHQNNFPGLLAVDGLCPSLVNSLPDVHEAARELFEYAFGKASDLKTPGDQETVRTRYHQIVHAQLPNGCCPFCGLEILEAPDADLVDPDLDHYLALSKYPFAGANLRNLTAMGTTCNRSYKGALDILLNEHDQKVDCIDPYGQETVSVSLTGTVLLSSQGAGPTWNLNFTPDVKSRNWRRIFAIEQRFKANILEKHYQIWLAHCASYARAKGIDISNRAGALKAVGEFKNTCEFETLPAIARLKTEFFGLVEAALGDPHVGERVHNFVAAVPAA